ncbi:zinc finger, CCHC-type, retrotransposon gag domain protein [Tanacetum coccineum]
MRCEDEDQDCENEGGDVSTRGPDVYRFLECIHDGDDLLNRQIITCVVDVLDRRKRDALYTYILGDLDRGSSGVDKEEKMVNARHKEVLKGLTSKEAGPLANEADQDDNDYGSSSISEDLNFRGFSEEETQVLSKMISRQVGKAIKNMMPYYISRMTDNLKNEMATYRDFTACDVPIFDETLNPVASTRWLSAVEGTFGTSSCKEKNKVNFASNFLRDSSKMWWNGKVCKMGEEWIGSCMWKEFKELFNAEYAPAEEVDKIQEEFQTLMQTNEKVNELWNKFNDLIPYCPEYHGNEKLKVERFQRMLRDDIREVISPFKCTTLDDLLSRARVREADLLRK